jgi:hypothetical protein
MWHQMPEQELAYINRRHSDLIAEAAGYRLAGRRMSNERQPFTGLRIQIGRLLIMVGQMNVDLTLPPASASTSRPPFA